MPSGAQLQAIIMRMEPGGPARRTADAVLGQKGDPSLPSSLPHLPRAVASVIGDYLVGAGKGVANTGIGLGEVAHRGAEAVGIAEPTDAFSLAREEFTTPANGVQGAGKTAEQIAEFFLLPGGAGSRLAKAGVRAAGGGGLMSAQGSSDEGAAVGAGLGALTALPFGKLLPLARKVAHSALPDILAGIAGAAMGGGGGGAAAAAASYATRSVVRRGLAKWAKNTLGVSGAQAEALAAQLEPEIVALSKARIPPQAEIPQGALRPSATSGLPAGQASVAVPRVPVPASSGVVPEGMVDPSRLGSVRGTVPPLPSGPISSGVTPGGPVDPSLLGQVRGTVPPRPAGPASSGPVPVDPIAPQHLTTAGAPPPSRTSGTGFTPTEIDPSALNQVKIAPIKTAPVVQAEPKPPAAVEPVAPKETARVYIERVTRDERLLKQVREAVSPGAAYEQLLTHGIEGKKIPKAIARKIVQDVWKIDNIEKEMARLAAERNAMRASSPPLKPENKAKGSELAAALGDDVPPAAPPAQASAEIRRASAEEIGESYARLSDEAKAKQAVTPQTAMEEKYGVGPKQAGKKLTIEDVAAERDLRFLRDRKKYEEDKASLHKDRTSAYKRLARLEQNLDSASTREAEKVRNKIKGIDQSLYELMPPDKSKLFDAAAKDLGFDLNARPPKGGN